MSTSFVCGRLRWLRDFGAFDFDVVLRLFFFVLAGAVFGCGRAAFSSAWFASGTTVDLRARFEAARGVLVATLADRTLLGVVRRAAVDLRGERRLFGDSPFTQRARRSWARSFPSAGTKILVCEWSGARGNTGHRECRESEKRTHHGRESAI